ncbi:SctF chaperone SctG [Candidatus Aerophobetes bacterium]|uniref:SctF chaperone SctG n=1 Tax=Aerophobetes bacterium TaxID=2030807 RepID=A0A2A4YLQ7_UNCAE|nr:MAG: SctF chaperone SctG [Candidatus Aerophobetes bacterium]
MEDMKKFKDHFVMMLEAGFIAVNQADEDSATKLFKAAKLLNDKSTLPEVGLGYLYLHKLELKQACKTFKSVLEREPSNHMAKALLGLSMTMTADQITDGEKILTECASKADDAQVKTLAESALAFVDEFIKKSPPPTGAPTPKRKNA